MEENIQYGYIDAGNKDCIIRMKKGQNVAGFPVGIIYIDDVFYPLLPGNVVNGYTYDFPVRLRAVEGLDIPNLFTCSESVLPAILSACTKLQNEGVRAISAACGFFGNYQKQVAQAVNVPVALSSLVQIPWIAGLIRPDQKIGILTADKVSITQRLFESCSVTPELQKRLILKDLRHEKEFSCILEGRGEFDNGIVQQEVTGKAVELVRECPETGAILLECSDMPPYAYAVQKAVQLPVFDFITLIKWLHNAVTQQPYFGFI
ncbi:MAG: aspartate/glutamate racemase family protein [Treponema sp.]|nr:aspartate/glutamate racemase family protein [Treponema sp.]